MKLIASHDWLSTELLRRGVNLPNNARVQLELRDADEAIGSSSPQYIFMLWLNPSYMNLVQSWAQYCDATRDIPDGSERVAMIELLDRVAVNILKIHPGWAIEVRVEHVPPHTPASRDAGTTVPA